MGSEVTRTQYEGILIQDRRITADSIWAAQSTYTEDSPQTGPITADSGVTSDLVLQASGTPIDGDALLLRVQRSGVPGPAAGGFAWRENTGQTWLGWDTPVLPTGYEVIQNQTGAILTENDPDVVSLTDGTLVVASAHKTIVGPTWHLYIYTRTAAGVWSAATDVFSETANGSTDSLFPQLIVLPSGRVLCFVETHFDDGVDDETQVAMWYADDPTGTWTQGSYGALPEPIDVSGASAGKMRCAYNDINGQILLTIGTRQYASRDLGATFESVDASLSTGVIQDIAVVDGYFVVCYDPGATAGLKRIASAFESIDNATQIDINAAGVTDNALVYTSDGALHFFAQTSGLSYAVSDDAGLTYREGVRGVGQSWTGQSGAPFSAIAAAEDQGRIIVVGIANSKSLYAQYLGGYTDLTLPAEGQGRAVGRQMFYHDGWCGTQLLSSHFTDNSTGTPTEALNTDGSVSITTGAGDVGIYDDTEAATTAYEEITVRVHLQRNSGTGSVFIQCTETTTPQNTAVEFRVDADVALYDNNAAAIIDTADVGAGANEIDAIIAIKGQSVTAWYRTYSSNGPRRWTLLADSTTLQQNAGGANHLVRSQTAASSDVDWYEIHYAYQNSVVGAAPVRMGSSLAAGFTNPDDLYAAPIPAGSSVWVNDGVGIRGIDGPGMIGETFSMELTHPNPVEHMLPTSAPSPRSFYRSSTATPDDTVAFQLFDEAEVVHLGNDIIGIYMESNLEQVRLQGSSSGSAWSTICDIDRSTSLAYTRTGSTVRPGTASPAASQYYHRDELAGTHVVFGNNDVREIIGNTEGNWGGDTGTPNERKPVIYLKEPDMDAGEPTSGMLTLVHRRTLTICHLAGTNDFKGYRIVMNATALGTFQDPPSGKYEIKTLVVGPFIVFGKRTDREYTITREAQVESTTLPDGTVSTRVVAPTRRRVSVSFSDGVDVSTARGSDDPNFIAGTSSASHEAIAHERDLPLVLDGLLDQLDGPHTRVVLSPRIPKGTPDTVTLAVEQAGGAVYGRIESAVTYNAVLGNPMLTEVFKGPSLTVVEEV